MKYSEWAYLNIIALTCIVIFLLLLDKIKEAVLDGVALEDEKREKFNEIQQVYYLFSV
jgi:hypothetical protein